MNYSSTIFVMSDTVRAIDCSYEPALEKQEPKVYTFKSFDQKIKVGDLVVVETKTRHNFTVMKVEAVDVDPPIEENDTKDYKWIVGTVDTAVHEQLLADEKEAISTIKKAEKRRRREELKETLLKDVGPENAGLLAFTPEGQK